LRVLKVFSTPTDPSLGVLDAISRISSGQQHDVRHGTTVGTNAMLEQTGARVAFVTTAGFEDTISIGRQTRSRLYDWFAPVPVCLVPRELRFGVPERVSARGEILRAPSNEELELLVSQIHSSRAQSIAISLLFSFANPKTEKRVEDALRCLGLPISVSHRILPEFREFERGSTTVVNAYLAPRMQLYLNHLEEKVQFQNAASRVDVMQSSGGIIPARLAAQEPVRTVLSGPAGGVIGACQMARWAGFERIIGFDMGGTSTDVFLSDNASGGAHLTRESSVAGVPISVPMLDIHTVGAGGGSIARFDSGGMLRVGPESAGAEPGPVCFGRGSKPTVTDANLLLGRLESDSFLGGSFPLYRQRVTQILDDQKGPVKTAEEFADGILRVVETNMAKAIRVISVERGHDPRQFALVAFGGGGPLHACSLARALRIPTVLIPAMPGALSAVGILLADSVRDYSKTVMLPGDQILNLGDAFALLEQRGLKEFENEGMHGTAVCSLDIRYRNQGYDLNVPYAAATPSASILAFHQLHNLRYGFSDEQKPVEIVNLRLRTIAKGETYHPPQSKLVRGEGAVARYAERPIYFDGRTQLAKLYRRELLQPGDELRGPALITEYTSATVLPPGCNARVDSLRNLVISIDGEVES
jgi:N-methylhydantoinase A